MGGYRNSSTHVDIFKGCVSNWLITAADAIVSDVNAQPSAADFGPISATVSESITSSVQSKLDIFNGLRPEYF
eukprot:2032230-Pleurochrysis_carterae.AAC.1